MKKFILQILLFLMFIPFVVNAETCDTDKITISSITVESKSDNVEELDEATASGKNINFNLSMTNLGDNIEYKIVVKNDSNKDYLLDKNSFNISSDYIEYNIESEDNSYVVKANSSKTVYLKINYANEVPDEAYETGKYNDNKTIKVNLSTGDTINVPDTLKNPNTGDSLIFIVFLILIISGTSFIILKKTKYIKYIILIIGTIITIPISAYALCKFEIIIESNIIIRQTREVVFYKQWSVFDESEEFLRVKPEEYYKYLDLYATTAENYDPKKPQLLSSDNLMKINSIIPIVKSIDSGYDYVPSWNDQKYWYEIIFNAPTYDENGNELHYVLKENHIVGVDIFGGSDPRYAISMGFDPFEIDYNRQTTLDELLSLGLSEEDANREIQEGNNIYCYDFPLIAIKNHHAIYGVGEGETLYNFIGKVYEMVRLIG